MLFDKGNITTGLRLQAEVDLRGRVEGMLREFLTAASSLFALSIGGNGRAYSLASTGSY